MPLSSNEFAMNHHLEKSKQVACLLRYKFQLKVITDASFEWRRGELHKKLLLSWNNRMWVYPNDKEGLFITREYERYCQGGGMYLSR
jgi:hypothetical protein